MKPIFKKSEIKALLQKPRCNAVLKSLRPEQQAEIYDYTRNHTRRQTLAWLADKGIKISERNLRVFWSWYTRLQLLKETSSTVRLVLTEMKKTGAALSDAQLTMAGQVLFSSLAIKNEDSVVWKRTQEIRARNKALALEERRVRLLERQQKQAKPPSAPSAASQLTPEEREDEYKRILGLKK